ncbi:hypothetical protein JHK85_046654 [Glycine max]|nr:hypothetical protein JHK85_046654 [Glycine max]
MGAQPANLIEKIGDLTPVQDFEALFSRRDSPDWVEKAINETKKKIFDLVGYSHEGDNYPKALECLVVLRKGCILEQATISHIPAHKRCLGFSLFNL